MVVVECDSPAILSLSVNDGPRVSTAIPPGAGWQEATFPALSFTNGTNRLRIDVESGSVWFKTLTIR